MDCSLSPCCRPRPSPLYLDIVRRDIQFSEPFAPLYYDIEEYEACLSPDRAQRIASWIRGCQTLSEFAACSPVDIRIGDIEGSPSSAFSCDSRTPRTLTSSCSPNTPIVIPEVPSIPQLPELPSPPSRALQGQRRLNAVYLDERVLEHHRYPPRSIAKRVRMHPYRVARSFPNRPRRRSMSFNES
ncbi:uncharacterized protein LAESUDRAFT_729709 [Laetiporus sulphureus 93-53]|uniref:Uncharacterized protein n=1 Tax=Laetiporus sulphureus 93-53 TaxID=1314785 RepID=A0A165CKN4_9APHY|nr:uncharacterized protein LAESUDRAFT_729709 [Laetiporus sulphureus 93-53]KZT02982.1 hypothetical protein LAESUDRAFT_729709 [Laetiporus sulphureus 93-53]